MKVVISFLVCILSFPSFAWSQVKEDTGLFVVIVNDKRGFIDRNGKVVIAPQFERAGDFSEGVAIIATHRDRKEGYIDETGKIVIDTKFDRAYDFSEGLALVGAGEFGLHNSGDHEYGFIDKSGNFVIQPQFPEALSFSQGLAAVQNDKGKWGYINTKGELVIGYEFKYARSFSEDLAVVLKDGRYGFIDKLGRISNLNLVVL